MTYCQMPNQQCPNEGTARIRIAPAGDRSLCESHVQVLESMGADFRRLDDQPRPAWMQRDLARDESRRVA